MKKTDVIEFDDFFKSAQGYIKDEAKLELIKKAYEFAKKAHEGQYRLSGDEYITHPLAVAMILTETYVDYEALSAALLHDVLEDCDIERTKLEEEFGTSVTDLVFGVTKIGQIKFSTKNDALVEYYKKIIVGMSEDVRVIIIKLADRLHNMRTLWAKPVEKQKETAKETLEILSPIAHHLGIYKIKSELEDLSLRYLKPDVFYDIAEKLNATKLERDESVNEMLLTISKLLNSHNIKHSIKGRSKSIYSIYKKLEKGKTYSDIYDLMGLRVLVKTEADCYSAIGIIHSRYRPIPGRFKDYVALPKPNGYQSLHTTVLGIEGFKFEIQVRTYEMDELAENGIASHWAYKENKNLGEEQIKDKTVLKLQAFKEIIDINESNMSSEDFITTVKEDILNDSIYAFTPKGDIIELPIGSSPIDFAYRIHTRVGETTTGAIVNDEMVPLNYEIQNNDVVKIITDKNSVGPSREWLDFVKTSTTKSKIRSFFTKSEKENYIERGKSYLEKALRKKKLTIHNFLEKDNLEVILKEFKLKDIDELYLSVGKNIIGPYSVIGTIYKEETQNEPLKRFKDIPTDIQSDVTVAGIDSIKVSKAQCCHPVKGDKIIGYITKNSKITIHRAVCQNISYLDNRLVSVSWKEKSNNKYETVFLITTTDSVKAQTKIEKKAQNAGVNIKGLKIYKQGITSLIEGLFVVKDLEQLHYFKDSLLNEKTIESVIRVIR